MLRWLVPCLVIARVVVSADPPRVDTRPNILFVMIDDLGWMDVGFQGNERFDTPHLDAFAADGMRFTDYYAAAPVCSPTRAACITGLAPARVRITNHVPDRWSFYVRDGAARAFGPGRSRSTLPEGTKTIAERLHDVGYHTGFIGKWHLAGDQWNTRDVTHFPESHGFDVNVAGNAMGGPGTFFAPFQLPNYERGNPGDYLTDHLAREAIEYLTARKAAEQPFFLCLWTYTVHYPIEAPAAYYARYADERDAEGRPVEPDMPTRYRAMVAAMDDAIGRVLKALDDLALSQNTLVVFTSDNGQMPGASVADPLRDAKGYLHEGGIRVPLVVRWPGHVPSGSVSRTPCISMDFAPTFLDAAGIATEPGTFDGVSLLPVLERRAELERDALFFHYPHYAYHGRNAMASVVRMGDWKYIHHLDSDHHELYDLAHDLGERTNLAERHPERVGTMRARLETWLEDVDAAFPRPYDSIPADELLGKKLERR